MGLAKLGELAREKRREFWRKWLEADDDERYRKLEEELTSRILLCTMMEEVTDYELRACITSILWRYINDLLDVHGDLFD